MVENKGSFIKRVGGYLHRVSPVFDKSGKVVEYVAIPLMVEIKPRDIMQIIVGASILAVPVAFTEETWVLGSQLPFLNVLTLSLLSLLFIAVFVYYNFYRNEIKDNVFNFAKRVLAIYCFSLLVVGAILTIIGKCPWGVDNILALKRIMIVAFPSSMSATLSDTIK
jgi:uncharacterized membrane protein